MSDRNLTHLNNMIKYCQDILDLQMNFGGKSFTSFMLNKGYQYSVSFCIEQIGELAKKLREGGFAAKYPYVEWDQIVGMRNRIAHGYDVLDLEMVYDIATEDIPKLLEMCQDMLEQEKSLQTKIEEAGKQAELPVRCKSEDREEKTR